LVEGPALVVVVVIEGGVQRGCGGDRRRKLDDDERPCRARGRLGVRVTPRELARACNEREKKV
jgi:hypothetical protein